MFDLLKSQKMPEHSLRRTESESNEDPKRVELEQDLGSARLELFLKLEEVTRSINERVDTINAASAVKELCVVRVSNNQWGSPRDSHFIYVSQEFQAKLEALGSRAGTIADASMMSFTIQKADREIAMQLDTSGMAKVYFELDKYVNRYEGKRTQWLKRYGAPLPIPELEGYAGFRQDFSQRLMTAAQGKDKGLKKRKGA